MGFFTTDDGVKLHYETLGAGEKTLVFIHGYFDSGKGFASLSGGLQKKYRVVVYDHRAHGESEVAEDGYTITRLAADLKNLLDELALKSVVLIGYSMGVHVLYRYVELYGMDGVGGVVLSVMSPKLVNDESYHLGLGGGMDAKAALEMVCTTNRSIEEYALRGLRDDMPEAQKKAMHENAQRLAVNHKHCPMVCLLVAMLEHDFWPMLDKITCPALVIAGEHDIYPAATQREVHRRIPGSKLVILKDCGHMMMYERPEAYAQEIADFVG